jgi:hypothetical protein
VPQGDTLAELAQRLQMPTTALEATVGFFDDLEKFWALENSALI